MSVYFFSPWEPKTSPQLFVVVFNGGDIDLLAEDRSVVWLKGLHFAVV